MISWGRRSSYCEPTNYYELLTNYEVRTNCEVRTDCELLADCNHHGNGIGENKKGAPQDAPIPQSAVSLRSAIS